MANKFDQLKNLQELRSKGTIDDDEFYRLKQEILAGEESLTPTEKLAKKKMWIVILCSVFFPILAYAYTGRWKQFRIFLIALFAFGFAIGLTGNTADFIGPVSIIATIFATVDNCWAIEQAKQNKSDWGSSD